MLEYRALPFDRSRSTTYYLFDERNPAAAGLSRDLRVDCRRGCARAGRRAASSESGLLRLPENGGTGQRLRPSRAEVESGEGVLRGVRVWPRPLPHPGCSIRLSAVGRRIFCRLLPARAGSLATSACSPAASLIGSSALARPATAGRGKRNSKEGFYEIPINYFDRDRAGWHCECHFQFGRLLRRRCLLPGQTKLLRQITAADS